MKILYAITEHRILGVIIDAYIVLINPNKSFFSVDETISEVNQKNWLPLATEADLKIFKLMEEFKDEQLLKIFSRDKNIKEFYKNLDPDLLETRIKPFIEKRLVKIIALIIENKIKIYLKDKNYNTIHQDDEIKTHYNPAEPVFNFNKGQEGTNYFLTINTGGKELKLLNKKGIIVSHDPCYIVLDKNLYKVRDIDAKKLMPFFLKTHISVQKSKEREYYEKFVSSMIKKFKVHATGFEINEIEPDKHCELILGRNLENYPAIFLSFWYNNFQVPYFAKEHTFLNFNVAGDLYSFKKFYRNYDWEKSIIEKLKAFGLNLKSDNSFILDTVNTDEPLYGIISWFNQHAWDLKNDGFIINQKVLNIRYFQGNISLKININRKNDWFDIFAMVHFDDFEVPFIKLRPYLLNNIREYELPDGSIAILPSEWFTRFRDIFVFGKTDHEKIRIRDYYFPLLNQSIHGIDQRYLTDFDKLVHPEKMEKAKIPLRLQAELRSYQKIGYAWLINLQKNKFGGCLADDMGLGKTLQTLAILQSLKEKNISKTESKIRKQENQVPSLFDDSDFNVQVKINSTTSLIIVPTSLVHNWENEIKKFSPDLKIYKYTGWNRNREFYDFKFYDIVLTTYGVVRNDVEILQSFYFHYIILDESQIIKNPAAKIYKAILKLQSENKLVLTGTPIENSLIDLWSQLNFVNRGLLGNLTFFKTEFVTPIEKLNDKKKQEQLQELIKPFILRRTKSEVASDLPPVTEQILYCDMPEEHNEIYEKEKSGIRNMIIEQIEEGGVKKASIFILQGLNRLRQMANHPVLIYPEYQFESGKFNEIILNLHTIISEGHKLLIFSSYVKHLNLIKDYLDNNHLLYCLLTGESKDRGGIIKTFQEQPEYQIFLISLKAGGVGLNLTAADYVFIIDPWWNPASEEQALSRAHRIGQDKNVFIYRFITTNTIEEKIQKLKEKKSELANIFVNTANPFKNIDMNKIEELFE